MQTRRRVKFHFPVYDDPAGDFTAEVEASLSRDEYRRWTIDNFESFPSLAPKAEEEAMAEAEYRANQGEDADYDEADFYKSDPDY